MSYSVKGTSITLTRGDSFAADIGIVQPVPTIWLENLLKEGVKIVGTMPNNGGIEKTISKKGEEITIPQGYHDGSGKVGIDPNELAKIIEQNIKKDVVLFGVRGGLEPSSCGVIKTWNTTKLYIMIKF